jgi:hypothetical protein
MLSRTSPNVDERNNVHLLPDMDSRGLLSRRNVDDHATAEPLMNFNIYGSIRGRNLP